MRCNRQIYQDHLRLATLESGEVDVAQDSGCVNTLVEEINMLMAINKDPGVSIQTSRTSIWTMGHRPELQGQQRPPTQQNISIDLGPTLPYTVPNTRAVGTCNRMA